MVPNPEGGARNPKVVNGDSRVKAMLKSVRARLAANRVGRISAALPRIIRRWTAERPITPSLVRVSDSLDLLV
jgi:hypothetical protein